MQDVSQAVHGLTSPPFWVVGPHDTDWLAWAAIATIGLAIYFVLTLYAKFDQWAEHKSEGTPLAKTIPTILTIALLYEIFPLDHFHFLLPLSAILLALMADWMRERDNLEPAAHVQEAMASVATPLEEQLPASPTKEPVVQAEVPVSPPEPGQASDAPIETSAKNSKPEDIDHA